MARVYRGHIFHITGAPAATDAVANLRSHPDGALVVRDDGTIGYVGDRASLPEMYRGLEVVGDGGDYLLPGFVDTHIHFPQTYSTEAYGGGQLLEWLERCIFPAEARLADPVFARAIARDFTRRRIQVGTTAAMVFGSAFPAAQDELFAATREAGLRIVSGRGIQTVGPDAAAPLITDERTALRLVTEEIDRHHGGPDALEQVAVVPRFSPSVTTETLAALGELYDGVRGRGVYFHSHLNENNRPGDGEIALVRHLFETEHYLDTYDGRFLPGSKRGGKSLLGPRSILAHGVHCDDVELARMAETGTSIAHCPTSQLFLGSGTMPWRRTVASGVNVALGTDVGAGDEWLISRVMNDSFKVHMSEPGKEAVSLHPAELLFSGTLAGARALDQERRFGNLDAGKDADFLVIDPRAHEPLERVLMNATSLAEEQGQAIEQELFALLLGLREPALREVYVRGRRATLPA